MGRSGLPDIYAQSPRAAGPKAEGVYIRATTSAHGIPICNTCTLVSVLLKLTFNDGLFIIHKNSMITLSWSYHSL